MSINVNVLLKRLDILSKKYDVKCEVNKLKQKRIDNLLEAVQYGANGRLGLNNVFDKALEKDKQLRGEK